MGVQFLITCQELLIGRVQLIVCCFVFLHLREEMNLGLLELLSESEVLANESVVAGLPELLSHRRRLRGVAG